MKDRRLELFLIAALAVIVLVLAFMVGVYVEHLM